MPSAHGHGHRNPDLGKGEAAPKATFESAFGLGNSRPAGETPAVRSAYRTSYDEDIRLAPYTYNGSSADVRGFETAYGPDGRQNVRRYDDDPRVR